MFHPNTVWDANVTEDGDLLTACGDGVLRIFSNDPSKWMEKKDIDQYNSNCLTAMNKGEDKNDAQVQGNSSNTNNNLSVNQLPNINYIYKNKGKEGELRAFNNNGKGEAWMFKEGNWEKIGDVIGGEDNNTNNNESNSGMANSNNSNSGYTGNTNTIKGPKYYPGDKIFAEGHYDFIFDVEFQGKTTQIPFDYDGNKLVTAEKYCKREGIHALYKEDIIKFLKKNANVKPVYENISNTSQFTNHFANSKLDKVKLPIVSALN